MYSEENTHQVSLYCHVSVVKETALIKRRWEAVT